MARRRLLPSLLLLGLAQLHDAHAATTAFGNKPVQLLAPTDAARTALKPVEEGLRALESLQVGWVRAEGVWLDMGSFDDACELATDAYGLSITHNACDVSRAPWAWCRSWGRTTRASPSC